MLIAPIFHNNYLKLSDSQDKSSDASSSSAKSDSSSTSSRKYNNFFKTAFNRGTEILKNTFLPKPLTENAENSASAITKDSSAECEKTGNTSSTSTLTPESDCSSPDSIKTELMYFKPITREPKILSGAQIIRVPSIRSTSSSSSVIHSPCPSPFFIPISSQRQSAFTFVAPIHEDEIVVKPKRTAKRNTAKTKDSSPKRKLKKTDSTESKTEPCCRETRSMRKQKDTREDQQQKEVIFKSPPKVSPKKRTANVRKMPHAADQERRVTRSMKN